MQDGSGDPRGSPGQVEGASGRFDRGWGTLGEGRDGLVDPRRGPGRVGGPSGRSGTGWENLGEVRDGSENSQRGSKTGLGTLGEVQDRLGEPRGGPGRVVRPSGWSETGQGTLGKIRDGLRTWRRSATGRETFGGGPGRVGEVRNG